MVHAEGGWAMSQGFGFKMAYRVNFENATADYDCTRSERPLRLYTDGKDSPHWSAAAQTATSAN
jgi:hypothetical protein